MSGTTLHCALCDSELKTFMRSNRRPEVYSATCSKCGAQVPILDTLVIKRNGRVVSGLQRRAKWLKRVK
jgi:hypothetical protein